MTTNKTILIISGEASGDLHGAGLMKEMLLINKSIKFIGLGGSRMEELGLQSLAPLKQLAVMGFWEVAKKILFFINLKKKILHTVYNDRPDKVVLIDYPGFNLNIAKTIKKNFNIPVFYYISPQLWAWKEKRIKVIQKYVDKMIVVFPFEKKWYKKRGFEVQYFGHPIVDIKKNYHYKTLNYKKTINIAVCPGSRLQEVERHMPILRKLIKKYNNQNKLSVNFIIIKAQGVDKKELSKYLKGLEASIVDKPILEVFQYCHFGIVASGTASLESAITTRPFVVIYKMSWISWYMTQKFIKISFACIVNILANKIIVPELLQNNLTVQKLADYIEGCYDQSFQIEYKNKINGVINGLGDGNVYKKTAQYILNQ